MQSARKHVGPCIAEGPHAVSHITSDKGHARDVFCTLDQVLEDEAVERAATAKNLPDFTYGHILELRLVRLCAPCCHVHLCLVLGMHERA